MRHVKILLAAAMTVGGINVLPAHADTAKAQAATPATLPSQLHATITPAAATAQPTSVQDKAPVRHVIADLTSDALTSSGMDKLIALFPDAQRKQIAQSSTYSQNYGDKLDSQIQAIGKTWKEKYGHDFAGFNGVDAIGSDFFPIAIQNAGTTAQPSSATVTVGGPKSQTSFAARFLCESGNHWKADVPAAMTAQKLRDNLTAQLTAVEQQSGQWPAQQYDAYRMVTRHVMMAVFDQPSSPKHADAAADKTSAVTSQQNAKVTKTSTSTHHWWQFWYW